MMLWNIVKPPAWIAFRMVSRLNLLREYRYVFILAHMRSGSTLLAHILASHPDFVGAGETKVCYRTPADLPKLILKTCELLHRPILRGSYIVDQINASRWVTDEVLLSEQIYRRIILLRQPEPTLKSMMRYDDNYQEKEALQHYINRLEELARYGSLLRERAFLVEYDNLVDQSDHTLAKLTNFLGLDSPLSATYGIHRMTGRIYGLGDNSNNIKVGRIIRTPGHDVTISKDTLTIATRAFHNCRAQLQNVTYRMTESGGVFQEHGS